MDDTTQRAVTALTYGAATENRMRIDLTELFHTLMEFEDKAEVKRVLNSPEFATAAVRAIIRLYVEYTLP